MDFSVKSVSLKHLRGNTYFKEAEAATPYNIMVSKMMTLFCAVQDIDTCTCTFPP